VGVAIMSELARASLLLFRVLSSLLSPTPIVLSGPKELKGLKWLRA
jgi:hypothetical protein